HNYFDTNDPEVYEYNICWSNKDLPFTAELSFFNHTAKGLTHVLLSAQDYETKSPDLASEERISLAIKRVLMLPMDEPSKPSMYLQVPLKTKYKLSGNYRLPLCRALIHSETGANENNAYITFPIYSENQADRQHEGSHRAIQIAAALTTITQQLFTVNGQATWKLLKTELFNELWEATEPSGDFFDDSSLLRTKDTNSKITRLGDPPEEVIDSDDCIVDNQIILPIMTDTLLDLISKCERLIQSCSRFREGLDLRDSVRFSLDKIYLISYELIAYVSAIEALIESKLDTFELECPSCGEKIAKEQWKISEKYRSFVKEYSDANPIIEEAFKKLYGDRSKFVHTGISLHNFLAYRPNRPMTLLGKHHSSDMPKYYLNIHEYTGTLLRQYLYKRIRQCAQQKIC
ncbi:MAG: hypothetical protein ACRYF6_00225, partial [Janthinobacterium lividum]